jgi:KUP system potassium uptake protein
MTTWSTGRELVANQFHLHAVPAQQFIDSIAQKPPHRVEGTGVYLHRAASVIPPALLTNLRHHEVVHERIVLLSVEHAGRPRVPRAQRASVEHLGEQFYQVILTYGFMEQPDVPEDLRNITSKGFGFDERHATYFLGKETVLATKTAGMQLWRERLFVLIHRNATNAAQTFQLPATEIVEVGVQVPI